MRPEDMSEEQFKQYMWNTYIRPVYEEDHRLDREDARSLKLIVIGYVLALGIICGVVAVVLSKT